MGIVPKSSFCYFATIIRKMMQNLTYSFLIIVGRLNHGIIIRFCLELKIRERDNAKVLTRQNGPA